MTESAVSEAQVLALEENLLGLSPGSVSSCVTSGRSHNLSEPLFPFSAKLPR